MPRMTNTWITVLLAAIGGIVVTLQGQFMAILTRELGAKESIFITYAGGGLLIALFILATGGGNLGEWRRVPPYVFTSGLLGLIIVGTIGIGTARLGPAAFFAVMLAGQFALAILLDHFGWLGATVRPLDWQRAIGVVLLLMGVWLILRR